MKLLFLFLIMAGFSIGVTATVIYLALRFYFFAMELVFKTW